MYESVYAIAILAILAISDLHPGFVSLFRSSECKYTGGEYHDRSFRYRLFVPKIEGDTKYPLLVWLHGLGEGGDDNEWHLRWLDRTIFTAPWERHRYPFFILAVQCPGGGTGWYSKVCSPAEPCAASRTDDMVDVAYAVLEQTIQEYPVDEDRIYLSGVSSGGSGCWEFAIRHPEVFAAVAPLSSGGSSNPHLKSIVDVPIWTFHCTRDGYTPVEAVRGTVAHLKQLGGTVHLTEIDSDGHDSWSKAFNEYGLMDWLLAQRRGGTVLAPSPGTIPMRWRFKDVLKGWQWWQVLLQAGFIVGLLACAVLVLFRIRGSRARRAQDRSELPTMDALLNHF